MSPDFQRFLLLLFLALMVGLVVFLKLRDKDPAMAMAVACAVVVAILGVGIYLFFRSLEPAGSLAPTRSWIPTGPVRERLTCPHCSHEFWSDEAGSGYAGSRDDFCDTCPACRHWVRDR